MTLDELETLARIMADYRIDSIETEGVSLRKSQHRPFVLEDVEVVDSNGRTLEGILNAQRESGRVPPNDEEILFAASQAGPLSPEDFAPIPTEVSDDGNDH